MALHTQRYLIFTICMFFRQPVAVPFLFGSTNMYFPFCICTVISQTWLHKPWYFCTSALISPQNNSNFAAYWQHFDDSSRCGWQWRSCGQVEAGSLVLGICHTSYFRRVASEAGSFLQAWRALLRFCSQAGTPACHQIRCGVDLEPQISLSINPGFDCFHWLMV